MDRNGEVIIENKWLFPAAADSIAICLYTIVNSSKNEEKSRSIFLHKPGEKNNFDRGVFFETFLAQMKSLINFRDVFFELYYHL